MATVTAKEIAAKLGVSASAVSIALNGKPGISDETRAAILKTAVNMGFNSTKLSAAVAQHKKICFLLFVDKVVSLAENTTFSSFVLKGADAAAASLGYSMQVRYLYSNESHPRHIDSLLNAVDGIILLGTDINSVNRERLSALYKSADNIPMVIVDNVTDADIVDCVGNDNFSGAFKAVEYLISRGCSNIGYLRSKLRIKNFEEREAGVRAALRNHGMLLDNIIDSGVSFDGAYKSVYEFLSGEHAYPDGIFAENDVLGVAAIRACRDFGIKVPEDISVIGFDDIPISTMSSPALTTIHSFKEQLGELSVQILSRRFAENIRHTEPNGKMKLFLSTSLVVRDSVK